LCDAKKLFYPEALSSVCPFIALRAFRCSHAQSQLWNQLRKLDSIFESNKRSIDLCN